MAVTSNQLTKSRDAGRILPVPVAASKHIYEGTLVYLASGYATDDDNSGANPFLGIARREVDNSAGQNGDLVVEVFSLGVFELVGSGFSQASVGANAYGTDNYTITTNSANARLVGRIVTYVSSTKVEVAINPIHVPELGDVVLNLDIADLSADATYDLVMPFAGNITKLYSVIDGAVSTADVTITPSIGGVGITNGVITIATASSAAGDVDSATPTAANAVTAGQAVRFTVAGGGSGGSPRGHLTIILSRTA